VGTGLIHPELDALIDLFWERLSPATRGLLDELAAAPTWGELCEVWGFTTVRGVQLFARNQLRKRVEREVGPVYVALIRELINELG